METARRASARILSSSKAARGDQNAARTQKVDLYDVYNIDQDAEATPRTEYAARAHGHASRDGPTSSSRALPAYDEVLALLPADLGEERIKETWERLPTKHGNQKEKVMQKLRQNFKRWRFQLRQGCNLLFYGLGSKRLLLETFAAEVLVDGGVLAFYAHQPGLSAKQVLSVLANLMTHKPTRGCSHAELLGMIQREPRARRVYIIVHNIDGPGLRGKEEQLWLSRLSQLPQVSLVASCDHVNAPLLWDQRLAAAYRWLWCNVTNFASYEAETAQMLPVLTTIKQTATKRGASTLLAGLVHNARQVFITLAEWQLDDPDAPGISFAHLFRLVRERFILSSEQALRTQLTEFRDHELVKLRAGPDGGEVMYIPMNEESLGQVLEDMQAPSGAQPPLGQGGLGT